MLTIMVALHCEAKPFIDAYRLKKVDSKPFDHYQNIDYVGLNIDLVVSGIGALAMASAVGWIGAKGVNDNVKRQSQRIWVNLGTAGHISQPLGSLLLVHGVGDEVQQKCHYPPLVAKWHGASDSVLSVSSPCTQYPDGAAVDMEAYAFFTSALRFSDAEFVQSLKVVSDNQESGIEGLNAAKLTEFMSANLLGIKTYINELVLISRPIFSPEFDIDKLLEIKGTHSHRLQVIELVKKLSVMNTLDKISEQVFSCASLKDVLLIMNKELSLAIPTIETPSIISDERLS